jgi:hypothetical protein
MGTHHSVVHRHSVYPGAGNGRLDDADLRMIASRIILQAVDDWQKLIRFEDRENREGWSKTLWNARVCKVQNSNYGEIRAFFRSAWGATLCGMVELDSEVVLEKLEQWLNDYHAEGVFPQPIPWDGTGGKKRSFTRRRRSNV